MPPPSVRVSKKIIEKRFSVPRMAPLRAFLRVPSAAERPPRRPPPHVRNWFRATTFYSFHHNTNLGIQATERSTCFYVLPSFPALLSQVSKTEFICRGISGRIFTRVGFNMNQPFLGRCHRHRLQPEKTRCVISYRLLQLIKIIQRAKVRKSHAL